MQEKASQKTEEDKTWPNLPDALQHRMSTRWTTMEALRILQERVASQGSGAAVLLLTSMGPIRGKLADISDSYEENMVVSSVSDVDVASATAHLRTDLWRMYEKKDPSLEPIDSASLVHLTNVTFRVGNRRMSIPHMALFANEILGYCLIGDDTPTIP